MGRRQGSVSVHILDQLNTTFGKAICRNCGPVETIVYRNLHYCPTARNQRSRNQAQAHGLTLAEADNYKALVGCCEICGSEKNLRVDHNHATKQLRGVLCHRCNVGIHLFENPALKEAIEEYLIYWNNKEG
jgi:hypothetical protein